MVAEDGLLAMEPEKNNLIVKSFKDLFISNNRINIHRKGSTNRF